MPAPKKKKKHHVPHPMSPAGRGHVWSGSGLPHPQSPAARYFHWSQFDVAHPLSPAARNFTWAPVIHANPEFGGADVEERRQVEVPPDLTGRLKAAIELALKEKLTGELKEKVKELVTPEALATMAAIATAYGVSQFFGVGEVLDVILAGWGIWSLGGDALTAAEDFKDFFTLAKNGQIDQAADKFAQAIAITGVDGLLALLAHKASKRAKVGKGEKVGSGAGGGAGEKGGGFGKSEPPTPKSESAGQAAAKSEPAKPAAPKEVPNEPVEESGRSKGESETPVKRNTNPYDGPVTEDVIVVDEKGNAIQVKKGQQLQGSKDGKFVQVKDSAGKPTGTRIDGPHKPSTHPDPRAQQPHAHVPGVENSDGTTWLPIKK